MINAEFVSYLEKTLAYTCDTKLKILNIQREHGGDINHSFKLDTNTGQFFLKVNNAEAYPMMFEKEFRGLTELTNKSNFRIPEGIQFGVFNNLSFLLMEYLPLTSNGNWMEFGRTLASMHLQSSEEVGLDYSNYIGSIAQHNTPCESWAEFYSEMRLLPLCREAFNKGLLEKQELNKMERLCARLSQIYPVEKPALIHGDLWSGNIAFCKEKPCIYDPAIYYGHREMDLAMTLLFGSLPIEMYQAYNEVYSLEKSWKSRIEVSQLYPLLVHLLLFGTSYAGRIKRILKSY